uniref:Uncharacterized protein n=1 Tax=Aegilops tauschii subsp. strangulata TaxID=200361 RepID=A0A453SRH9_AEGTS
YSHVPATSSPQFVQLCVRHRRRLWYGPRHAGGDPCLLGDGVHAVAAWLNTVIEPSRQDGGGRSLSRSWWGRRTSRSPVPIAVRSIGGVGGDSIPSSPQEDCPHPLLLRSPGTANRRARLRA